jgi:hypothetical protein
MICSYCGFDSAACACGPEDEDRLSQIYRESLNSNGSDRYNVVRKSGMSPNNHESHLVKPWMDNMNGTSAVSLRRGNELNDLEELVMEDAIRHSLAAEERRKNSEFRSGLLKGVGGKLKSMIDDRRRYEKRGQKL